MMKNFMLIQACSLGRGLQGLAPVCDNDFVGSPLSDMSLFLMSLRTLRHLLDSLFVSFRGVKSEVVNG